MRFFHLLNFQHLMIAVFPTLIFIILLALALGFSHIKRPDSQERYRRILHTFPDGIEGRNAPFPFVMILIVVGAVLWTFFYILMNGVLKVKI
jgi:hypothetical protein